MKDQKRKKDTTKDGDIQDEVALHLKAGHYEKSPAEGQCRAEVFG